MSLKLQDKTPEQLAQYLCDNSSLFTYTKSTATIYKRFYYEYNKNQCSGYSYHYYCDVNISNREELINLIKNYVPSFF